MDTIKKVMVLAGGNDQIELIKGLRRRFPGVEVLLVDMNDKVRAREYADRQLVISTMDFDAVLSAAREEGIDMIISACGDQPLRTMAYISEQMHLPCYLTYRQSLELTNKVLMKKKMLEGGIPTARFHQFDINSEISVDGLGFPLVIKPADNNGSKGIIKVYSEEEFQNAIREARKYTLSGDLLVEEFKDGEEYSVEAFIREDGSPIIVFASKNIKIKNRNTFTICRNEYVPLLTPELEVRIKKIVADIGKVFGIRNVPLLIQMIVRDLEVNVIEFSARTGGGSKLFFIREMVGVDVIDNLIDITIGAQPDVKPAPRRDHAAVNYIYTTPGIFTAIEGADELLEEGLIRQLYLYKTFGSKIASANYSSDRPAGFLTIGTDRNELEEKLRVINRRLKVIDENGVDIMRHDLLPL